MRRVDVWVAPLQLSRLDMATLVAGLSPDELTRAARYLSPEHGRRFATARGWLRRVLAAELGIDAAAVAFVDGRGKPRLVGDAGPCFNLSHAGELAVVAVADDEVGVDVEHLAGGRAALEATALVCAPAETAALERLPPGERAEAFLRLWTAKEAYLKARGVGLTVPPDWVEIGVAERGGAAPVRLTSGTGSPNWWVRELALGPDYVGAVVMEGPDFMVRLRDNDAVHLMSDAGG